MVQFTPLCPLQIKFLLVFPTPFSSCKAIVTVNDRQHVYDSPRRLEGEKLGNESSSSREMADGVAVLTVSSSCRPFFFPLLLAHVNEEIVAGIYRK